MLIAEHIEILAILGKFACFFQVKPEKNWFRSQEIGGKYNDSATKIKAESAPQGC